MYDEETRSILRDPYARRAYQPLTKAEEDHLIVRAVRGEAAALAEILGRYRGLIVNESRASYLRTTIRSTAHHLRALSKAASIWRSMVRSAASAACGSGKVTRSRMRAAGTHGSVSAG